MAVRCREPLDSANTARRSSLRKDIPIAAAADAAGNRKGAHMTTNKTNRRSFLGRGAATAAVAATAVPAKAQEKPTKKVLRANGTPAPRPAAGAKNPRMSATVLYGNLLFISGVGYHQEGDIKVHTK